MKRNAPVPSWLHLLVPPKECFIVTLSFPCISTRSETRQKLDNMAHKRETLSDFSIGDRKMHPLASIARLQCPVKSSRCCIPLTCAKANAHHWKPHANANPCIAADLKSFDCVVSGSCNLPSIALICHAASDMNMHKRTQVTKELSKPC